MIGEVFVDDPTVIALGLIVNEVVEGNSNDVLAVSFSKVVPNGRNVRGPETLNVRFTVLLILSASNTKPPEMLKTVLLAETPRFPVAPPVEVEERITTASADAFVEEIVVEPPPPQALNSMVL